MSESKFNGWSNYETWLVNLWLINDEYYSASLSQDANDCDTFEEFVECLECYFEDMVGGDHGGFLGDIISTFESQVYWEEIAEYLWLEREEEEEEEEEETRD